MIDNFRSNVIIKAVVTAALLFLAIAVVSCVPQESQKPPDRVAVQLKWVNQAQFAGFYVASEKGLYAKENINIMLVEGGTGIDPVAQVLSGKADFGIDAPENIIVKRSQGKPLVAIATIYQRSPVTFIALANSGIKRPHDFPGHSLAVIGAGADAEIQLRAMMKKLNLDVGQIKMLPHKYDYSSFYQSQVDIAFAYTTGGLIRILQKGYQVNVIYPGDYGIHMHSDTLFTTEDMIRNNPDLVTRFLRATLTGWRQAVENTDSTTYIVVKYAREADRELQRQMLEASMPLIHTGKERIGWMSGDIWENMNKTMVEQGLLPSSVDVKTLYTMEFLNKVYASK